MSVSSSTSLPRSNPISVDADDMPDFDGAVEILRAWGAGLTPDADLGLPLYARTIPDRDRDEWVRLEIESNPLPICTRPQVLRSARQAAFTLARSGYGLFQSSGCLLGRLEGT